ncbi:hypothetical protein [Gimesia algae]|uniref:Outer membrane lipoprotein-sorting protein n=1 Tax=Gimesia algae TaxID=2527971 RepID=A0A517V603_9PLAN|nr:hypothetical protein [Gimesia algae]QDT88437.1 hypothetical protein Pan161_00530 [Gimesia algae]
MYFRLTTCVCLLSLYCSTTVAEEPVSPANQDAIDKLVKISTEVKIQLRSYTAEGHFREYDIAGDDFPLLREAKITAKCNGARYYLSLEFTTLQEPYQRRAIPQEAYQRRVILFDGSTLATSRFSPRISVTGAAGDLFPARASRSGIVSPQIAHFPWDIAHLDREVCYFPMVIENLGRDRLACSYTPQGDITAGYLVGRQGKAGKVDLLFRKKDGFHLGSYRCENPQRKLMQSNDLAWTQIDGVWCVKKMIEVSYIANKKWELEFNTIKPNAAIEENTFALEALELPARSRIIERGPVTRITRVAE